MESIRSKLEQVARSVLRKHRDYRKAPLLFLESCDRQMILEIPGVQDCVLRFLARFNQTESVSTNERQIPTESVSTNKRQIPEEEEHVWAVGKTRHSVSPSSPSSAGGGHNHGSTNAQSMSVPAAPKTGIIERKASLPARAPLIAVAMIAEMKAVQIPVHGPGGGYITKSLADATAGEVRTIAEETGKRTAAYLFLTAGMGDDEIIGEHRTDEDWSRAKERAGEAVDVVKKYVNKRRLWNQAAI